MDCSSNCCVDRCCSSLCSSSCCSWNCNSWNGEEKKGEMSLSLIQQRERKGSDGRSFCYFHFSFDARAGSLFKQNEINDGRFCLFSSPKTLKAKGIFFFRLVGHPCATIEQRFGREGSKIIASSKFWEGRKVLIDSHNLLKGDFADWQHQSVFVRRRSHTNLSLIPFEVTAVKRYATHKRSH